MVALDPLERAPGWIGASEISCPECGVSEWLDS